MSFVENLTNSVQSAFKNVSSAVRANAAAVSPYAPLSFDLSGMMAAVNNSAAATNAFNAEQAELNRNWQEMMSNTAHRREMADLQAAGLNPILSARQGASTPSGGQASGADATGAIAGLLGQVLSVQSAQAIANRNNATARLLEEMREKHDIYVHNNYPSNLYQALGSLLNNPKFVLSGSQLRKQFSSTRGWQNLTARIEAAMRGSHYHASGRSGKF